MPKYKVGDRVTIKKQLIVNHFYMGSAFHWNMLRYQGKSCIIRQEKADGNGVYYKVSFDGVTTEEHTWTDAMFENFSCPFICKDKGIDKKCKRKRECKFMIDYRSG